MDGKEAPRHRESGVADMDYVEPERNGQAARLRPLDALDSRIDTGQQQRSHSRMNAPDKSLDMRIRGRSQASRSSVRNRTAVDEVQPDHAESAWNDAPAPNGAGRGDAHPNDLSDRVERSSGASAGQQDADEAHHEADGSGIADADPDVAADTTWDPNAACDGQWIEEGEAESGWRPDKGYECNDLMQNDDGGDWNRGLDTGRPDPGYEDNTTRQQGANGRKEPWRLTCYAWGVNGWCEYAERCKFRHDVKEMPLLGGHVTSTRS